MKTVTKPQDLAAAEICFGVEIETMIPVTAGITVGAYHRGTTVTQGRDEAGLLHTAPVLAPRDRVDVGTWHADRDGSIRCDEGYMPCEFVSPILRGEAGLENLCAMIEFIQRVGGKVNASCGLHITVGIKSVIGSSDTAAVKEFVRKIGHVANQNAWAIYAQTGTGRHTNGYSASLAPECAEHLRRIACDATPMSDLTNYAAACGRGMVNLQKAFMTDRGAIEFRAFAGTLNREKVLHHLATVLGLVRRAAVSQVLGAFKKSSKKNRASTAPQALRRMWRILGWCDATECQHLALGLFGMLHAEFGAYRKAALEMAEQFEARFPAANL